MRSRTRSKRRRAARIERGEIGSQTLEVLRGRDEVRLALELDDGPDLTVEKQRDGTLGVLPVVTLGGGGEVLLA